jgi:Zn-dependent peptidase ImmA (M78 family)/DNA-binding XRE family transcriptional regulator
MIGSPGFIGERLEQARKVRGLTAVALAEMLEVKSATNITQYEHGKQSPSPEVLEKMVARLNRPRDFFFKAVSQFDHEGICYRSMSSATKTARMRAEVRLLWLKELVSYLRKYMDFPKLNIPAFSLPGEVDQISLSDAEDVANECRRFYGLGDGPLPDVVLLLENNGVIVTRGEMGAETLDALSQSPRDDAQPYVFLGTDKSSAVRSRFDAAHELGHLLLHCHIDRDAATRNTRAYSLMEQQCHRFASAFLLPETGFGRELWAPTLNSFLTLKPRWKTSIAAMMKRSEELGILEERNVRRSWINLSRRGWRKEEPLDGTLKHEQPRLLRRSVELLVDSGIKTKDQILADLSFNASDIESLACLPDTFFKSAPAEAVPVLKEQPAGSTVIPFRARPRG